MFLSDEKNFMKPATAFDWFMCDATRRKLHLNPDAFSREQFWSKLWCLEMIKQNLGTNFNEIFILGGWYGTMAAMFLQDPRFQVNKVINFDLDSDALRNSKLLISDPRYFTACEDLNSFLRSSSKLNNKDLIICSICEHIDGVEMFNALQKNVPIIFQSTNLKCEDHINTKESLDEFKEDLSMIKNYEEIWAGTLDLIWFKRFMSIGLKR